MRVSRWPGGKDEGALTDFGKWAAEETGLHERKRRGSESELRRSGPKMAVGRKRKGKRKSLFIFRKHFREKE
jgi:hypothetical protein